MQTLVRRFRSTHFVFAKWDSRPEPFQRILTGAVASVGCSAPVDLISFPVDSDERFIGRDGTIRIAVEQIHRVRW